MAKRSVVLIVDTSVLTVTKWLHRRKVDWKVIMWMTYISKKVDWSAWEITDIWFCHSTMNKTQNWFNSRICISGLLKSSWCSTRLSVKLRVCSTKQGIHFQVIVPGRSIQKTPMINIFVLQCKQEYYILVCTIMLIGMCADERF